MSATVHATLRVVLEIPVRPSSASETLQEMFDASKREAEGMLRNHLPPRFRVAGPVEFVRATVVDAKCTLAHPEGFRRGGEAPAVSDAMVNRFLSWRLPADFAPDGGVAFTPPADQWWPTGTNLLHAGQAKAMLEHVLSGASGV